MRQIELWRAAYRFFLDGFQQATASVESGRAQSTADALRLFQPVGENLTTLTDMALTTSELKRGAADGALVRLKQLTRRVMQALGAVGAAALVSAAAWSIFFPGRLLRPILLLHEAATRLSEGELSARADVRSSDELGDLAARFNRMAETIEQRTGELEAQSRRAEAARDEAEAANAKISEQLSTIKAQRTLIGSLSVPILPLNETTLVVPLVGELDSDRMAFAQERLLQAIQRSAARSLILDITAVPVVDTKVADGLMRLVRAVELLGAEAVLVGIRPEVARSLVELGVDLGQIATQRSLQSGIAHTVRRQR
jgi:rsbT co-antagonist protein RsbR